MAGEGPPVAGEGPPVAGEGPPVAGEGPPLAGLGNGSSGPGFWLMATTYTRGRLPGTTPCVFESLTL